MRVITACKEMVGMYLGDSADKYYEYAPYTLLTRDDGSPVHIYDRPVYQLKREFLGVNHEDTCSESNDLYIYDTLIYTGM
jgi:hypothetical protein